MRILHTIIQSTKKVALLDKIRSRLSALLVSVLLASNTAQALIVDSNLLIGDEEIFLFREATALSSSAKQRLESLRGRLEVIGVEPVRVNLSALVVSEKTKGQPIAFNIENTKALHLKIDNRKKLDGGNYVVHAVDYFDSRTDKPSLYNEATLIIGKQNITGIIRSADGQVYELEYLDDENYALIHIDSSKFPPDDHPLKTVDVNSSVNLDWWNGERNFFVRQDTALRKNSKFSVITEEPTTQDVEKISMALPLLSDNKRTINLNLTPDINLPVMFVDEESIKNSGHIWRGKIINSRNGSITLSVKGKKITGIIRTDADSYLIEPLAKEKSSILVKVNSNDFPPEHPVGNTEGTEEGIAPAQYNDVLESTEDSSLSNKITINVLVAYTPKARQAVADINAHIDLAVSEANQSYTNSGAPIELKLVHTYEVNYIESGVYDTDVKRFRVNNDKKMDDVHAKRKKYKADIAVLIVDNNSSCGLASTIMAKSNTAFAAVHYACAVGNYSFAHEIGHLQGARHDKESNKSGIDKVCEDSAYGYFNAASGWRTIMAYNNSACVNGNCTRIPYWSNPSISFQSNVTGELKKNNAACLTKTRNKVAKFKK